MTEDVFQTQKGLEKVFQENPPEMAQVSGKFVVSLLSFCHIFPICRISILFWSHIKILLMVVYVSLYKALVVYILFYLEWTYRKISLQQIKLAFFLTFQAQLRLVFSFERPSEKDINEGRYKRYWARNYQRSFRAIWKNSPKWRRKNWVSSFLELNHRLTSISLSLLLGEKGRKYGRLI